MAKDALLIENGGAFVCMVKYGNVVYMVDWDLHEQPNGTIVIEGPWISEVGARRTFANFFSYTDALVWLRNNAGRYVG